MAEGRVMAALPNGRVGGGARASSSLRSRPHKWTGRRLPELARDAAARPRVPPCCSVPLWVRALQPSGAPAAPGRQSWADGRAGPAADLSLCPSAWFCCCRRGRQVSPTSTSVRCSVILLPLPSPNTAPGVFGLSPLYSACIGEMFPVPEGMKGLGLVSMATGRKRWVINPSPPSCDEGGGVGAGK